MAGKALAMRVPAALTTACAVLLILGCLEFDEQHVYVEHDQENDRLILIIDYQGLYDDGAVVRKERDEEEGATDQLWDAVQDRRVAFVHRRSASSTREIREALASGGADLPPEMRADADWLVDHVTVLHAGSYADVPGRLCAAQVVILESFSEFMTRLNRFFNALVLQVAQSEMAPGGIEPLVAAARDGHAWLRVEGHSMTLAFPTTEAGAHEGLREMAEHALNRTDDRRLRVVVALALANPVLLWHADGAMQVKVGMASQPSRLLTRPRLGDYEPNLLAYVEETAGLGLDPLLARYLLDSEAAAHSEAERAARIMAPRLSGDDRARVLLHQLATDPSEPYWQMLRNIRPRMPRGGPGPHLTDDEQLVEFWRRRLGGPEEPAPPPPVTE